MLAYALTIFTGAFLLFQVQPLIGKYILPWFGGGPGVWTTCMLFFQVLLLGGYAYAHYSSRWLKARSQAAVHLGLLAAALVVLPIIPANSWKPHGGGNPTLQILALLTVTLGLPYFVLSSTGPLLQHWFSRTNQGRSPYRLYALSNIGSLLALVSYPVYFETHFTRKAQAGLWGWGLLLYGLGCGFCAVRVWKASKTEELTPAGGEREGVGTSPGESVQRFRVQNSEDSPPSLLSPLSPLHRVLWLLLPACASVLLLATTNKMCQDVAVIPFLWVLPLALYLLSFIICFDSPRWYKRFPFALGLIAACFGICWALFEGTDLSIYKQVGIYSGGLFICCMVCHGELYRLRPDPRHLTLFYLMIAAGGALGGIFVVAAAPFLFTDYYELHWGLLFCGLLFVLVCAVERSDPPPNAPAPSLTGSSWPWLAATLPLIAFGGLDWLFARLGREHPAIPKGYFVGLRIGLWLLLALAAAWWLVHKQYRYFRYWRLVTCAWLILGWLGLAVALWSQVSGSTTEAVYRSRNFYGVLTVFEHSRTEPSEHHFLLQHGRITHGLQFVDREKAAWPTSYYAEQSGIGLAVNALPAGPRRIGVVGLGTATFTAYGRPGDYWRIYEINRDVKKVATSWFTYLTNCAGRAEVVLGDARLSMEQEPRQQFDLLALDAFSSDAIPVHLLTEEAFELYGRHLKTNGIIVVHISNHYLDLEPVVVNLARQFNYKLALIDYDETEDEWWLYASTWIIMTRDEHILKSPAISEAAGTIKTNTGKVPLWTDDFASLFQILK